MKQIKFSVRSAVLTILISSILLVSVIVLYAASDKFNSKLMTYVVSDIENIAQNCKEDVTGSIFRIQTANELLGVDEDFINLLNISSQDDVENYNAVVGVRQRMNDIRSSISVEHYSNSICFIANSDMPLSEHIESYMDKRTVPDVVCFYNDKGLDKKNWYSDLVKSTEKICIFEDEEIPRYIYVAQLVENGHNPEESPLGVVLVGIDFESILRKYGGSESNNFLEMMILNSQNEVICTNDETISEEVRKFASTHSRTWDTYSDSMTDAIISGSEYYASMQKLDFGMTLVTVVPKEEAFITVRETTYEVYTIVLVVLVIILIIAVCLSGVIVRPIKKLSDYMKYTDAEQTVDFSADESRIAEIDTLNKAYGSMIQRNKKLLATAETLGEQKKESEFKMLQAQINPHYLYNALDSISWMALRKGEEDIADMISDLADSFRYNAKTSEMMIDFKSELNFIESYVKLQEKFRDISVELEIDVSDDLREQMVPKFVLQPLVENVIIHGIKRNTDCVKIKIVATKREEVLEIHTIDNGAGFDADALNRHLGGDKTVFDTEKIGIINIHKRLKNKYGEEAGLRYVANKNGGLTAIISLALREGEKDSEIF